LAPDDPETISSVGTFHYYAFRDYDRATEQYEKLARLQPNSPSVFNSLGLIQRRQGHWAESLVNFHKATELDPANISYQRNQLGTLRAGRRWDEMLVVQRRIVALLPDSLREAYRLATIPYQASGSTREGDEFFSRLSPAVFNSPEGIYLRQGWAGTKGDYAEFIRLDKLQPYFDGYGEPHWRQAFGAASIYWSAGDRDGMRARLENYPTELHQQLEHEPNNRLKWAFLGGMELLLGHKAEGLRCAERATAAMPVSRDALEGVTYANYLAYCHDLAGDKERALAEYQRQINIPSTIDLLNVHELKRTPSTLRGDPRFEALLNDPKNNAPLF
jgi:tetratricopeptide (TPR) repeat protein